MGVNSLPKTVTRQRSGCDLNPCPSAPESSTLTTRLPSHPVSILHAVNERVGRGFATQRLAVCRYKLLAYERIKSARAV